MSVAGLLAESVCAVNSELSHVLHLPLRSFFEQVVVESLLACYCKFTAETVGGKNNENRSPFGEVVGKSRVSCFSTERVAMYNDITVFSSETYSTYSSGGARNRGLRHSLYCQTGSQSGQGNHLAITHPLYAVP